MQQNILVVGGSSGIGLSLVQQLSQQGAQVWAASRHQSEELSRTSAQYIPLDITQGIGQAFDGLPEQIHGLAYCIGSINLKPFHRLTMAEFQADLQLNLLGAIEVLQALYPRLKKANGASVVLFSTVAAALGMNFHASIATAKAAVEGLGKSLAAEWASQKIRVNVLAPSLTQTPLAAKLLSSDEKVEAADKRHPLGRVGQAEDLAHMAAFLLSEKASWISGQIIGIDGGMGSLKP